MYFRTVFSAKAGCWVIQTSKFGIMWSNVKSQAGKDKPMVLMFHSVGDVVDYVVTRGLQEVYCPAHGMEGLLSDHGVINKRGKIIEQVQKLLEELESD